MPFKRETSHLKNCERCARWRAGPQRLSLAPFPRERNYLQREQIEGERQGASEKGPVHSDRRSTAATGAVRCGVSSADSCAGLTHVFLTCRYIKREGGGGSLATWSPPYLSQILAPFPSHTHLSQSDVEFMRK